MKQLELRRHARRDPSEDRLSPEGRAESEDLGRSLASSSRGYDVIFVSPAERAAETAAWILRGAHLQLAGHEVIPGLAGKDASGGSPEGMASGVRSLLARMPEGACALAISHTPLVERTALGLAGLEIEPLKELDGILVTQADDGTITVEELRRR